MKLFIITIGVLGSILVPGLALAMPPGTLLFRTSSNGKMFGYSQDPLLESADGILRGINAGHTAVYIGKEDGVDYIVEALAGGIVKTPAKYFVNRREGEGFLGSRLPKDANPLRQAKVVALAKNLAARGLAYDYDFKSQKGPGSGQWTCVGLTEKLYESADIANPNNLASLEYDPAYYAVDITPDGFDNYSLSGTEGDVFSKEKEFSKIARRTSLILPAPELLGYNAGLEKNGQRYIFLPYTQFLQPGLAPVPTDVLIYSEFSSAEVRGDLRANLIILRWSLINNPISSLKYLGNALKDELLAWSQGLSKGDEAGGFVLDEEEKKETKKGAVAVASNPVIRQEGGVSQSSPASVSSPANTAGGPAVKEAEKKTSSPAAGEGGSESRTSPAITSSSTPRKLTLDSGSSARQMATTTLYAASPGPAPAASGTPETSGGPSARINRLYATAENDWLELYNPGDKDIDLKEGDYRLEKAKSAADPALMMRIGNEADGRYPGGTVIKARGRYLIVRDDASSFFQKQAQAIATRNEFSWTGSGYTIYLGTDAISSYNDPDILEVVGFGADATYFQGSGPASEIADGYVLERQAATGDNRKDYRLAPTVDPDYVPAVPPPAATTTPPVATTTPPVATTTPPVATTTVPTALINRIYATASSDWVELINPGPDDFDLFTAGIRLEKSKTATDPSLVMRIGNEADGVYPGGTVIKAGGTYLIVRDDATDYWRSRADAIGTRPEFGWTGDGYSMYLGRGPVSSKLDPDLMDLVGYGGEVPHYLGAGPAPAISDGSWLKRVAATGNNNSDFILEPASDPDYEGGPGGGGGSSTAAIKSPGLIGLWHFDECYGDGTWAVGKWGCARQVSHLDLPLSQSLIESVDLNSFSASFYYRGNGNFPRAELYLSSGAEVKLSFIVEGGMLTVGGLPGSQGRYYQEVPLNDSWHQAVIVVNQPEDYWAVYIDGQEVIREEFMARLALVGTLGLRSDNSAMLIDELAIWNRPLPISEIKSHLILGMPFYPNPDREPKQAAVLLHHWPFSEGLGSVSAGSGGVDIAIPEGLWTARRHDNYAISLRSNHAYEVPVLLPLESRDLSLAFWWRNSSFPNEGRADIYLRDAAGAKLFALLAGYYRPAYWFNGIYGIFSEGADGPVPHDAAWHHIALTYDSYTFQLRLFVDGRERASQARIWMRPEEVVKSLWITSENYPSEIDELRIYRGTLSPAEVMGLFQGTD